MVGSQLQPHEQGLSGVRIALPESRELDLFARMVEQRGARALRYPLIAIRDTPDQASVHAWLERFIAGRYQDALFYTGEGLRRLLAAAQRAGMRNEFVVALGTVRKIVRGPKPERALRDLGLRADLHAVEPTTAGIIATLDGLDFVGRRLGVQIYGDQPPAELVAYLDQRPAVAVDWVAPYIYADDAETEQVIELLDRLSGHGLEVIAFTSSAQVDRLFAVAAKHRDPARLVHDLNAALVAAVGPVVAGNLAGRRVAVAVIPERRFFLKPLVRAIEARLASDQIGRDKE